MRKYKHESDKSSNAKVVSFSCNTPARMSENSRSLEIGFKLGHLLVLAVSSSGQFVWSNCSCQWGSVFSGFLMFSLGLDKKSQEKLKKWNSMLTKESKIGKYIRSRKSKVFAKCFNNRFTAKVPCFFEICIVVLAASFIVQYCIV